MTLLNGLLLHDLLADGYFLDILYLHFPWETNGHAYFAIECLDL